MTWATSWKDPFFFWLLIPLAAAVFYAFYWSRRSRPSVQFSGIQLFQGIAPGVRARLSLLPRILKVLALVLVVVSLARPQSSSTKTKRNVEGIDIMIALDVSDSMLIEDMKPDNRLNSAKHFMKEFIERRASDRIGLAIFSGDAYTRVPPTLDYKVLQQSLAQVEAQSGLKMGTAIGLGLATAVARLKESTAKSRVIILLTDGENNSGNIAPETALEMAKGYGMRIYTVGIGRDGDAQLPVYTTDMFGNKIKHYQPIHSSVNDQLLGQMADETGGKYYRAAEGTALNGVFKDIDRLEKSKVEVNQFTRYTELFPQYLIIAALLYVLALAFGHILFRRVP